MTNLATIFYVLFLLVTPLTADQLFTDKKGIEIRIAPVKTVEEIDHNRAKEILVKAFMKGYEDVPLVELNPKFTSIGDVRRFYEEYFENELEHFTHGSLTWVQAFEGNRLLGWATFELETNEPNAAYMNLLVVDPQEQGRRIGKYLTFSIQSEDLFPNVKAINLLIRNVNVEGKKFYERIGFKESTYKRDNFVDPALLSGLSWERDQEIFIPSLEE